MPRFFIHSGDVEGRRVTLAGPAAAHLARSLRVRPGELIVAVEAGRTEHGVVVDSVEKAQVTGTIRWSREATGEPGIHIDLLQALPSRGMDDVVEALALSGVGSIRPVVTARSTARPGDDRAAARLERWRTIAREAAQLAGRAQAPTVHAVTSLEKALAALDDSSRILACMADAAKPLTTLDVDARAPISLVIGPEGGLDPGELEPLHERRAEFVHLGPRVVPTRLAGFAAVTVLLARARELDTAVAQNPPS